MKTMNNVFEIIAQDCKGDLERCEFCSDGYCSECGLRKSLLNLSEKAILELSIKRKTMFKPMYDRLYVQRLEDKEEKTASGLILTSESKTAIARGVVIKTGFGRLTPDKKISLPLMVEEDDIVVFQKYAGIDAGNDHIFLKEEEILAIEVSEVD